MCDWDSRTPQIFDTLDLGLILLDSDQCVVGWNNWLAAASGIAAADARGKTLEQLFPTVELRRLKAAVGESLASSTCYLLTHSLGSIAFPLQTRAGRTLLHDVKVSAVDHEPARVLIQIFDVTVTAERERLLRDRQNARYDSVVNGAADIILTLDSDDKICLVNPAAETYFNLTAPELIGSPASWLFEDPCAWHNIRNTAMQAEAFHSPREVTARRRNGAPGYLEASLSRWTSGRRIFITAILRNVEERRAAEQTLRASEMQFRSLSQALPNHVWTADTNGLLNWFNDRVYEYTGNAPGTLDGNAWLDILHPQDRLRISKIWTAAKSAMTPYEAEVRLRRSDGSYRWHLSRAFPVYNAVNKSSQWIGSNTDIEDQKLAADRLANLNATLEIRVRERTTQLLLAEEALRQSQKMEALGQLTGGIAHDFNNLLQSVIGPLNRIRQRVEGEGRDDIERLLGFALESANRAAVLTHRLLAFSRREPVEPKSIDLSALIASLQELLQGAVGEAVEMTYSNCNNLWPVRSDSNQLENVLLNLVINARDAMPNGGRLSIETANLRLNELDAKCHELAAGDYVCLRVCDNGVGMPPDVQKRAFEPFFTTKAIGKGTGLGLSMIYGFVKQFGGAIQIKSQVGAGTTIELFLPAVAGHAAEHSVQAPMSKELETSGNQVILVVEDEFIIRMLIVEELRELGYQVYEAGDGNTALQQLQSLRQIDLLVSDIGLPGLNGRQLADAARVSRPNLPILFLTGYAEKAAGQSFLEPGMQILVKPFKDEMLIAKVRELLEGAYSE